MLPASPRRQGVSSVHPQRYQGFNPTFSQGIILYYTRGDLPEMHCANVAVLADNNPDTQKNRNCSSSTPHLMGHGPGRLVKTRGRPHGHDGSSSISSGSTPQLMGSGPGRPVKTHGPPHGPIAARPGPSNFQRMGRGPARPIKISELLHRDQCRFPVECPGLRSRPSLPNLVTIARS